MAAVDEDVVAWRRHLHRHPEVSFSEHETSALVAETLEGFGLLTVERPTETSVLGAAGHGRPGRPSRCGPTSTRCRSTRRAASSSPPSARARCTPAGTTGTPRCCSARRASCRERGLPGGEVRFIFQHAEELAPGGARDMVAAGVMEGVDFVYGCHLWTPLEFGKVAAVPGAVHGRGGLLHGSRSPGAAGTPGSPTPRSTRSPRAAELVGSLQHVVSRRIDPLQPAVVTIGSLHAGDAPNVIPGERRADRHDALVRPGRARADPEADRGDRPRACARRTAPSSSSTSTFGYRPVVNDERATRARARGDRRTQLVDIDPIMGGDDFSAFQAEAPGCYAFIGAGGEYPHHHPRFRIDERALADRDAAARRRRAASPGGVSREAVRSRRRTTRCWTTCGGASTPRAGPTRRRTPSPEHGLGLDAGARARRVLARRLRLARGRGGAQRLRAVRHGRRALHRRGRRAAAAAPARLAEQRVGVPPDHPAAARRRAGGRPVAAGLRLLVHARRPARRRSSSAPTRCTA